MSHFGNDHISERIEEDIGEMSRGEKVEFIIDRGIAPSDWAWSSFVVRRDQSFGKPAWNEESMDELIFDWKWEGR